MGKIFDPGKLKYLIEKKKKIKMSNIEIFSGVLL